MARMQVTRRITRKGSKQLTDKERASQVASPTIPPENEGDDDEGEDDNDNDKREDKLFSDDSNADPDKGGHIDPDDNDPGGDSDPNENSSQSTDN